MTDSPPPSRLPRARPDVAVVLAGGRGTRMGHPTLPKPLVPVDGRPMLDRVLDGVAAAGFARVVLVIGHLGDLVEDHVGDRHDALPVLYARQPSPDGTADAVACAVDTLAAAGVGSPAALVTWCDIFVAHAHYDLLATAWTLRDVGALTTVVQGNPSAGALVEFDRDLRMTAFTEKPANVTRGWCDGGASVLGTEALQLAGDVQPSQRGEKRAASVYQALLAAGRPVGVEKLAGPWLDLGTPAAIEAAERFA